MTKYQRIELVIEPLALWALEYRSREHHDTDELARVAGIDITVGLLRRAFEFYFGLPFDHYQRAAVMPGEWERTMEVDDEGNVRDAFGNVWPAANDPDVSVEIKAA